VLYAQRVNGVVVYTPLPEATVTVRHDTGSVAYTTHLTDANGNYAVPCLGGTYSATLQLVNANVIMDPENTYAAGSGDATCGSYSGARQVVSDEIGMQSHVFRNMVLSVNATFGMFAQRRGRVRVLTFTTGTSLYDPGADRIEVGLLAVWGPFGVFTAAHEYGHAFHEKALGGIPQWVCPSPHYVSGAHRIDCAYVEGFPDFLAVAARGAEAEFYHDIRNNRYPPAMQGTPALAGDGSVVEGAVAGFLYDLWDGTGYEVDAFGVSWYDPLQLSGTYLGQVMQTCSISYENVGMGRVEANGVDHLIYCMEEAADPTLDDQGFFGGRAETGYLTSPSSTVSFAHPDRTLLRELWIKTLYGRDRTSTIYTGGGGGEEEPCEPVPPALQCST
jgi:hypothetical protein